MAKLTVANDFSFSPGAFYEYVSGLDNADTVKHQDDLWRVSYGSDAEVFVRGSNFDYNVDNELVSGDITSFSFNEGGSEPGEYGPALVRIRGIDNLSGAEVHNAIENPSEETFFQVLKDTFKDDDVLNGANEQDYLIGFKGDDEISGHGRGDQLYGGGGDDDIDGGGGQDYIVGGRGKDNLHGGGDKETGDGRSDTFYFANGDSGKNEDHADKIRDFVSGTDIIDLSQTGADPTEIHFSSDHGNTKIVVDAHDGEDKMVILVIGNDHVSMTDVSLINM